MYACLCAAVVLMLPRAASATTVNTGETGWLEFATGANFSSTATNLVLNYGAPTTSGLNYNLQFFNGSGTAALSNTVYTVQNSAGGLSSSTVGLGSSLVSQLTSAFEVKLTNVGSSFDLASSYVTDGTNKVDDVFATTPIPASLPLFLAGLVLMFGVVRWGRSGRHSIQPA